MLYEMYLFYPQVDAKSQIMINEAVLNIRPSYCARRTIGQSIVFTKYLSIDQATTSTRPSIKSIKLCVDIRGSYFKSLILLYTLWKVDKSQKKNPELKYNAQTAPFGYVALMLFSAWHDVCYTLSHSII